MTAQKISTHEAFELHELLVFKNLCATKAGVMSKLVGDTELKELMEQDFNLGQEHIQELQELLHLSSLSIKNPKMNQLEVSDSFNH